MGNVMADMLSVSVMEQVNFSFTTITTPKNLETLVFMKYNLRSNGYSLDLPPTPRGFELPTLCATKKPDQEIKTVVRLKMNLNRSSMIFAY